MYACTESPFNNPFVSYDPNFISVNGSITFNKGKMIVTSSVRWTNNFETFPSSLRATFSNILLVEPFYPNPEDTIDLHYNPPILRSNHEYY